MTAGDTIYALSSGVGKAAFAVVRLSGPGTGALLRALIGDLPPPRFAAVRTIRDVSGETLDRAIVLWFPGPSSFTGEDCAEFHLHGSPAVIQAVMAACSNWPDVRPAEAGEFTRRAFTNGKMDLVEAEGLADLLEARTAGQRAQAFRQMSGAASSVFDSWREQLLLIRADIEASVDFTDEEGVAEAATPGIDRRIAALLYEMEESLRLSIASEVIRDGVRVVLAGAPNTGKSSLLNALSRREAAIVSAIPGTTRDSIEVSMDIGGVPVFLTDTAGLRSSAADLVEEEGIRRTRQHMAAADVLLWVWSPDVSGSAIIEPGTAPDLLICNKADLEGAGARPEPPDTVLVSTRTGQGLTLLLERLSGLLRDRYGSGESSLLVSARQKTAVQRSIRYLNAAMTIPAACVELKAEDIRRASEEIGRLTGRVDVEEWLGAIFSRFCIGK